MSVFSETMKKSISIYRGMLRKYLPQAERVSKLHELGLKNSQLYESDTTLYNLGYNIVNDIKANLNKSTTGYYSYSGVSSFGEHLKNFLDNYDLEGSTVIHRSQKASRALIQAIQLLTLPKERLTPEIADQLSKCNEVIATFGSEEQRELHRTTLQNTIRKQQEQHTAFYRSILTNFQQQLPEEVVVIAATGE